MPHQEVYYTPPEFIDSSAGVLKIQGQEAHQVAIPGYSHPRTDRVLELV